MTAPAATLERPAVNPAKAEAAKRREQIDKIEKQFINIDAIRQWVKLQPVPGVLDSNGNQAFFDDVSLETMERFRIELLSAMQDKTTSEYEGKVRQGRVTGDRHVVT